MNIPGSTFRQFASFGFCTIRDNPLGYIYRAGARKGVDFSGGANFCDEDGPEIEAYLHECVEAALRNPGDVPLLPPAPAAIVIKAAMLSAVRDPVESPSAIAP